MPLPKKPLRVHANPWTHIDHQGRPAGVVPYNIPGNAGGKVFVGASVDADATKIVDQPKRGELRSHVQDTVWRFESDAVEVPFDPYYIRRLRSGELVAADEDTAKRAGVKFEQPKARLEAARKAAVEGFDAAYGEGAFAELERDRKEREAKAEAKAKAATKDQGAAGPVFEAPKTSKPER